MKRGVFIGRTTMDIVFYSQGEFPKENEKAKTCDYTDYVGGNACNAAITYALLGGEALLITAIGDSGLGRSLKTELEDIYHIQVIDVLEGKDIKPFLSAIWIDLENESRTIWGGRQAECSLKRETVAAHMADAKFILIDNQFPQMEKILSGLDGEADIPVVFDAERWGQETSGMLDAATEVIASADCQPPDGRDIFAVMKEKNVRFGAVTDGGKAVHWYDGEREGSFLPMPVEPVDTLGAGDILHGAYCYFRFVKEQAPEAALESASRVSSFSVAYKGPRQGVMEYVKDTQRE